MLDFLSLALSKKGSGGKEEIQLQEKTVTENGEYTADEGYDGLSKVTVEVASSGGENPWQAVIDAKGCYFLFGTSSKNVNITDTIVADVLNSIDTKNVTNISTMFSGCAALTTVPQFDTIKVVNMSSMFNNCTALTSVPLFDTRNVTDMGYMFYSCTALTSVPLFDTRNVTNTGSMFGNCPQLTSVPLFDTSKVSNIGGMFSGCKALTTVPQFDIKTAINMSAMFSNCKALTEIWIKNIKVNLQVGYGDGSSSSHYGHLLTVDSLVHLCYELCDTGSVKTLTVGTANRAKLADVYVRSIEITDEMRAEDDLIDEKLPFERCESTDEGATLISDYVTLKNWKLA